MFPLWVIILFNKEISKNLNVVSIKCTGPDFGAELNFSNHSSMLQSSCDTYCSVGEWAKRNFNTGGLQGMQ